VTRSARKDAYYVRTGASKSGAERAAKRAARRNKVIRVIKAIQKIGAIKAVKAIKEIRATIVAKVIRAIKAVRVIKEIRAIEEIRAIRAIKVIRVIRAVRVIRVIKGVKERVREIKAVRVIEVMSEQNGVTGQLWFDFCDSTHSKLSTEVEVCYLVKFCRTFLFDRSSFFALVFCAFFLLSVSLLSVMYANFSLTLQHIARSILSVKSSQNGVQDEKCVVQNS